MTRTNPLVLIILDGWGYREAPQYNAIASAHTPTWDSWWQNHPHILIEASGHCVGLPDEQMGNSEVGHMHMGAGRTVHQDFTRINEAIQTGELFKNPVINNTLQTLSDNQGSLHIMGLLSDGGVHSHQEHLFALLKTCELKAFSHVYLHLFLDGRDTPPQSAKQYIKALEEQLQHTPIAQVASLSGRYFAMDRDKRWERIAPVYRMLTQNQSDYHFDNALDALTYFSRQNISDEFIPPTLIGHPAPIRDGDAILFFNFRADRARQLTEAFINRDFTAFERPVLPTLSHFLSMTQFSKNLDTECIFEPQELNHTFGEVISQAGLSQLRLAETEKYAHVTFFFNGGLEKAFPNEDRILIPSPKVATYDLQPEMSAPAITNTLIQAIKSNAFDVIICNYANADMVGHSGNFDATIKAIECLDQQFSAINQIINDHGGQLLITADHGNAEAMFDEKTGQAHTAHTCLPVPLLYVSSQPWQFNTTHACLKDIAPTMLTLLGLSIPPEMTGHALLTLDTSND